MKNILDTQVNTYSGNIYDFDNNIILNWYPKRIIEATKDAASILELGVGHGHSSNAFSKAFKRHVVLDGSPAVIKNFNERFPDCNIEIIETYFEDYNTDERFDVIVLGFILEHVDDPRAILSKYSKFLTNNGKIYVAVPNAEALNRRLGHLAGLLPDMQALSDFDITSGHKRYYTVKSLTQEINDSGCRVIKTEGIYLKALTTAQAISLNLSSDITDALCKVGVDYPELCLGILAEVQDGKAGKLCNG